MDGKPYCVSLGEARRGGNGTASILISFVWNKFHVDLWNQLSIIKKTGKKIKIKLKTQIVFKCRLISVGSGNWLAIKLNLLPSNKRSLVTNFRKSAFISLQHLHSDVSNYIQNESMLTHSWWIIFILNVVLWTIFIIYMKYIPSCFIRGS